jgi:hypothetical protein
MSKYQAQSNADDHRAQDVYNVINLATDQLVVERAVQLIERYILEKWHETPSLPISHNSASVG